MVAAPRLHRLARRRAGARGEALARLGLDLDPSLPVRRLRPDQQQMVEIARALSIDARVLILDEPTSSLTDDEVESLFGVVRRLRDGGRRRDLRLAPAERDLRSSPTASPSCATATPSAAGRWPSFDRPRLIELMVGHALEDVVRPGGSASARRPELALRGARPHAPGRVRARSTSTSRRARSSGSPGSSAPGAASCWRRSSACASRTGTIEVGGRAGQLPQAAAGGARRRRLRAGRSKAAGARAADDACSRT